MNIEPKTLGDVCENISRPFDFSNHQKVVFINTGDVLDGKFLHKDYSEKEGLPGQAKKAIQKEDILFSEIRPINKRFAFVDEDCDEYVVSTKFMVLRPTEDVIPKYLYHYLKCDPTIRNLQREAESRSGTFPQITFDAISYFSIPIPSKKEQERISAFIDNIEKQIEVNKQMNEILEEIAKTLFKSWFIDFDPVRAKAEGRSSGLLKEISDLFPDSFEDSELGEIPKGWKADSLEGIINRSKDKVGDIESKVLSAVNSGELILSEEYFSKRVFSKDTKKYLKVQKYDFAYNPSRINIGSIGMSKKDYIGAVSPIYIVFKPKQSWQWFLEQFIRLKSTNSKIIQLSSGSVRQSLSYEDFASIPLTLPEINILEEFNKIFCSLREKIIHNENECGVLRSLRDTLLPKLISGELRIPNAEKLVEEASI